MTVNENVSVGTWPIKNSMNPFCCCDQCFFNVQTQQKVDTKQTKKKEKNGTKINRVRFKQVNKTPFLVLTDLAAAHTIC